MCSIIFAAVVVTTPATAARVEFICFDERDYSYSLEIYTKGLFETRLTIVLALVTTESF